jgi:integrase
MVAERTTLAEFLERWLRDYAANMVKPSTFQRYHAAISRHISPHLGAVRLDKLHAVHIQAMHSKCSDEGLSQQTLLHHHRILNVALKQAVDWGLLAANPTAGVRAPRPRRAEMQVLDRGQAQAVLAASAAKDANLGLIVGLALATGLRIGELLALRWPDIDFETGRLSVRRTVQRITGKGLVFGATKTHRSGRAVTLGESTFKALLEHHASQAALIASSGDAYNDLGLIFAQPLGDPYDPGRVSRAFRKLLSNAELPTLRFHDLRHTHATLLLAGGVHPKVVSERLGHATVSLTLDRYSHVLPGLQDEAARVIDAALKRQTLIGEGP